MTADDCVTCKRILHSKLSGGEFHSKLFYNLPYSDSSGPTDTGNDGTRPEGGRVKVRSMWIFATYRQPRVGIEAN